MIDPCYICILSQVLEEQGIDKYVDAKYLQKEIAEAHDITSEEFDRHAHALMTPSGSSNITTAATAKSPYYEHMGGYSVQELKDYNQYSKHDDLLKPKRGYSNDYSDDGDDTVYVTTLWGTALDSGVIVPLVFLIHCSVRACSLGIGYAAPWRRVPGVVWSIGWLVLPDATCQRPPSVSPVSSSDSLGPLPSRAQIKV